MGAANPITATVMTDAVLPSAGHVAKVLMNPASAETTVGAIAATAADAAGITYGLYRNSELLNN
jgi:predicted homoserine dehydrogenase-like protein